MDKATISLKQKYSSIISSRDLISQLRDEIVFSDQEKMVIDFRDVEFVSRSAAHQLLLLQKSLKQIKKVEFVNLNSEVEQMMNAVKRAKKEQPDEIAIEDIEFEKIAQMA